MDRNAIISLLRQLYRELRPTLSLGQKHVYDSKHWKHIVSLAKKEHTSTLSQPQQKKLGHVGENYLTYLKSTRQYVDVIAKYKGVGERNPKDLAHILGFRMPDEERLPRKPKCSKSKDGQVEEHPKSTEPKTNG